MIKLENAYNNRPKLHDSKVVRYVIFSVSLIFILFFLVMPILVIFKESFAKGIALYFTSIKDKDAVSAVKLTLLVSAISVPLNVVFGVAASWCIAKFDFWGKSLLITIIDLPFSVSPVISGLIFVLLFGANSVLGKFLMDHDIEVIFNVAGLVIATIFVTLPYVAKELIPLMQQQGKEEEEAAIMLGASGFQCFYKITLPNIKWGLLYGVLLCNARAMGEFGAVSVVSGHIRGLTNTIPLHVEVLYNDYNFVAAFSVASLLSVLSILTLAIKSFIEWKYPDEVHAI